MENILLFAAAGFLSVGIQSFVGFGSALIAVSFLTIFVPPQTVTPAFLMMITVMDILLVIETRAHVQWKQLPWLLIGGALGTPLGVWALKVLSREQIAMCINALVLICAGLLWFKVRLPLKDNAATRIGVGLTSGFLSGSTSMSGPPVVLFGLARGWAKDAFRGTVLAFLACVSCYGVIMLAANGLVTRDTFIYGGVMLAAALPASFIGVKLKNVASESLFSKIVLIVISLLAIGRISHHVITTLTS